MVRSRFLRNSSVPPSSSYGGSYESRSIRSSSTAPSRNLRAGSMAPPRDYRAGSYAPSRDYRASSAAPYRSSSVAPMRASSIAPIRASSIAPIRASSMAPPRSSYRSSSVTPYSRSFETMRTSYSSPYRASSITPLRSSSVGPVSSNSFRASTIAAATPMRSTYTVDTSIPTRQFGTRLGYKNMETSVKPAIYDEYYGMTYIPSSGRDSWSAYRISDEQLDDNDDLVYNSAKRDHDVMKAVNKQIVEKMSAQPIVFRQVVVPVQTRRFSPQPQPQPKVLNVTTYPEVNNLSAYRRAPVRIPASSYAAPQSTMNVSYNTRQDHAELLMPKRKAKATESFDFARPAELKNLKDRLSQARAHLDMGKTSSSRYAASDADMRAIDSEVQAIKNARAAREQSLARDYDMPATQDYGLVRTMMSEHKVTSDLRKRIRSTLRRTTNRASVSVV